MFKIGALGLCKEGFIHLRTSLFLNTHVAADILKQWTENDLLHFSNGLNSDQQTSERLLAWSNSKAQQQ